MSTMNDVLEQIQQAGIVPVVCPPAADMSEQLACLLVRGGLPLIEVTMRQPHALEVIRRMRAAEPAMLVGAGTVLTIRQLEDALAAGAQFIVTPGFDAELVIACQKRGVLVCPGVVTPSEIMAAMKLGLDHLKFFPADVYGGISAMKALHGPFASIKFMPTGGVSMENAADFLSQSFVFAVGGSFAAPAKLMKEGKWEELEGLVRQAAAIVARIRG